MYEIQLCNFNLKKIAESGQCFRIYEVVPNVFTVVAKNKFLVVDYLGNNNYIFHCDEKEFKTIWRNYFDIATSYADADAKALIHSDTFVYSAMQYGHGIRILKQDLEEMIISYLIARCINIPRIQKCIESMCKTYGTLLAEFKGKYYYSFPTFEDIASADINFLINCGLGFRAKDIFDLSTKAMNGEFDIDYLRTLDYKSSIEYLQQFKGIGPKVANCIALFGLHHLESIPEDVWIRRIRDEIYDGEIPWWYNYKYAGVVQQYVFYHRRTVQ